MYVGALRGNIRISVPLSSPPLQSKPPAAFQTVANRYNQSGRTKPRTSHVKNTWSSVVSGRTRYKDWPVRRVSSELKGEI